jgi:hypothetical protein
MQADRLVVHFDKRAHNPLLREAALEKACPLFSGCTISPSPLRTHNLSQGR